MATNEPARNRRTDEKNDLLRPARNLTEDENVEFRKWLLDNFQYSAPGLCATMSFDAELLEHLQANFLAEQETGAFA